MASDRYNPLAETAPRGLSPWLVMFGQDLRRLRGVGPLARSRAAGGVEVCIHHAGCSLWALVTWPNGARAALCLAPAIGDDMRLVEVQPQDEKLTIRLHGTVGDFAVSVALPTPARPVLRWTTRLKPANDLRITAWPRDLLPVDADFDPASTRGVVHTAQVGPKGNLLFASLLRPAGGSFLYVQDFGALTEYFEQTHTSAADRIGGTWPELGFGLPPAPDKPLSAAREVAISSGLFVAHPDVPDDDLSAARLFLDLYAQVYLAFPRPGPVHRDWPRRVDETIRDLTHSPECVESFQDRHYIRAYASAKDQPPESMVQLAVLVPLIEYAQSRGLSVPLIGAIRRNLSMFFDESVGCVVRWLPAKRNLLKGEEEQQVPDVVDSWYPWHAWMNLARLTNLTGDAEARDLFLRSIEHGMRVARRFDYRWPVFYNERTLEIVKAEPQPGRGGEHDVGALYAHVMMEAYELTGDRRYVDEALRAAVNLRGLGFALGYQMNNVSFGAKAMLRLWQLTGDRQFLGLADVCWANVVQNLWLWECKFGHARHYSTFLGLPPLQDAKYIALYEELEVLSAVHEYLQVARDAVSPPLRVLLPEYCRYVLDRAWYHYPSELPLDVLAHKPKVGKLHRYLSIPVEDLYEGWEKAGQVGQEVYGGSAPFVIATRHCHLVPGEEFYLHSAYPVADFAARRAAKRGGTGTATFRLLGDRRCVTQIRLVPANHLPLPKTQLQVRVGRGWATKSPRIIELGYPEFEVSGDAEVRVTWKHAIAAEETAVDRKNGSPSNGAHGRGGRTAKAPTKARKHDHANESHGSNGKAKHPAGGSKRRREQQRRARHGRGGGRSERRGAARA